MTSLHPHACTSIESKAQVAEQRGERTPNGAYGGMKTTSASAQTGADLPRRRFECALTAALTAGRRPTAGDFLSPRESEVITRIADEHPEVDHGLIINAYNIFRVEHR